MCVVNGIQTANGGITTNSYNHRGDLTGVMNPLGVVTADYTLDENGNVTVAVDGRGVRLSCTYDPLDRLSTVQYPDNTWATYQYDARGQITTLIEQPGSCVYTYDPVGRVSTVARPDIGTVSYLYDAVGNRRRMKDPDGGIATYTFDNANRVSAILNRYNENTAIVHNPVGIENNTTLGNGMRWRRTPDNDNNIQFRTLQHSSSQGSTQILRYTATYDAAERRTAQTDPNDFATYTYDATNQLIREQHSAGSGYDIQYFYDGMGNRTTMTFNGALTTYTHDAWNRLLSRQNPDGTITSYAYDGAGNRITETTGSDVTTYTWDYENRMSGVQHPLTGGIETFTYLLGRQRTVESGLGKGWRHSVENSTGKRFMVWDGQNLLQERDASGSLIVHYTGRPDDYWSLISQRRGSTTLYAIGDIQGNVREWYASDETSPGSFDFSAFGELIDHDGSVATPFGFEGEYGYYSDAYERLYVRARYNDPVLGRWYSVDPIGFSGGDINLWRNTGNDPVNIADPFGLILKEWGLGELLGAAAAGGEEGGEAGGTALGPWGALGGAIMGGLSAAGYALWKRRKRRPAPVTVPLPVPRRLPVSPLPIPQPLPTPPPMPQPHPARRPQTARLAQKRRRNLQDADEELFKPQPKPGSRPQPAPCPTATRKLKCPPDIQKRFGYDSPEYGDVDNDAMFRERVVLRAVRKARALREAMNIPKNQKYGEWYDCNVFNETTMKKIGGDEGRCKHYDICCSRKNANKIEVKKIMSVTCCLVCEEELGWGMECMVNHFGERESVDCSKLPQVPARPFPGWRK